jgi:hypothetical protein
MTAFTFATDFRSRGHAQNLVVTAEGTEQF